jgi:hypothetical protein
MRLQDKDQSVQESAIHEEGRTDRNFHTDTLLNLRHLCEDRSLNVEENPVTGQLKGR